MVGVHAAVEHRDGHSRSREAQAAQHVEIHQRHRLRELRGAGGIDVDAQHARVSEQSQQAVRVDRAGQRVHRAVAPAEIEFPGSKRRRDASPDGIDLRLDGGGREGPTAAGSPRGGHREGDQNADLLLDVERVDDLPANHPGIQELGALRRRQARREHRRREAERREARHREQEGPDEEVRTEPIRPPRRSEATGP
jgi:hypothetical protein